MTTSTHIVHTALAQAMQGQPLPSFRSPAALANLRTIEQFVGAATPADLQQLGSLALQLLVDRSIDHARAEREEAQLVDKLRAI